MIIAPNIKAITTANLLCLARKLLVTTPNLAKKKRYPAFDKFYSHNKDEIDKIYSNYSIKWLKNEI